MTTYAYKVLWNFTFWKFTTSQNVVSFVQKPFATSFIWKIPPRFLKFIWLIWLLMNVNIRVIHIFNLYPVTFTVNFYWPNLLVLGHIKKNSCFPSQRASLFKSIKKIFIFYFIEFDVFGTRINCFLVKANSFCALLWLKYVSIRYYHLLLW